MARGEENEQGNASVALGRALPLALKATFNKFPYKVKLYDLADVTAVKAVANGTATGEQQQRVMQFIVVVLCGTDDLSYRPGDDGRRDTDFAEGSRFVGMQLKRLIEGRTNELMEYVKSKVDR